MWGPMGEVGDICTVYAAGSLRGMIQHQSRASRSSLIGNPDWVDRIDRVHGNGTRPPHGQARTGQGIHRA